MRLHEPVAGCEFAVTYRDYVGAATDANATAEVLLRPDTGLVSDMKALVAAVNTFAGSGISATGAWQPKPSYAPASAGNVVTMLVPPISAVLVHAQ